MRCTTLLARELAGKAEVMRTAELIRAGLFGTPASPDDLLTRTGNLMILPHRYESVAWYEKGRFEQKHYGHHGGLTRRGDADPVRGGCDVKVTSVRRQDTKDRKLRPECTFDVLCASASSW